MNNRNSEGLPLRFLYNTAIGRIILRPLSSRGVSRIVGSYLDSPLSKPLISTFVKKNGIDLSDYYSDFKCFNDCFSRKIKEGRRPVNMESDSLISPCDGLLSVYRITEDTVFPVKQSRYTITSLLRDPDLAGRYRGGLCLVFRLCVNHYHRYCYIDNGVKGENTFIPGRLHTVRPIAMERYSVFTENCREYTVIQTENFGTVTQVEVGAMLVGKIKNHHGKASVRRGEEKGMFQYGGSTVILLIEQGRVTMPSRYLENARRQIETPVKLGEPIGLKI